MAKFNIKKNDTVIVLAGEDKGKTGKVLKVMTDKQRALVEGVNMVNKSAKPSAKNPQGGFVKMEAPIHISNISLIDPKSGKATRVAVKREGGRRLSNGKYSTVKGRVQGEDCSRSAEAVQLHFSDADSCPQEDCCEPGSW